MVNKKTMDMGKATKDQESRKLALFSKRELMMELRTSEEELSNEDAEKKLGEFGSSEVPAQKSTSAIVLFLSALKDPFTYVLALLMVISTLTKDFEATVVMSVMTLASVLIAFMQEYRSQRASLDLKELIENAAAAVRKGITKEIPTDEIAPGDIVTLIIGDMTPASAVLIWIKNLSVN